MAGRDLLLNLHPSFSPWALWIYDVAEWNGLRPQVTSGYRSIARQTELFNTWARLRAQGMSDAEIARDYGLWTPAYPGRSLHNYGLAFDLSVERVADLGGVWRSVGGYWAGPGDPVHFAATRSVDDLQ